MQYELTNLKTFEIVWTSCSKVSLISMRFSQNVWNFQIFHKDRDTLNDVMCTCNATSALTSGPLALDVLLIRLNLDLDLVAIYYPWKGTPPSTELVARVEWAMMMLLRSLEHALLDYGVSRQFTCLWNLAALSILIPLLRTTCYHASVAWVFPLSTNPNPNDMWPHEGPEHYWQVGP
jgi:hypothetical protein